ncbi:hypothetical protein [Xenophilus azovorans]|uniref:hypothetical protein n=1 Tax=Xenophilus azovorans TaxID=151755 RepID=UPI00056DFD48|nr:hypothetical protein [Xenophilus azovorans]
MPDHPTDPSAERAFAHAQQEADRTYLQSIIDRRTNLVDAAIADNLMTIFPRALPGTAMEAMFERACHVYTIAVASAGYACLTREVCRAASEGTLGELQDHFEADREDDEDQ